MLIFNATVVGKGKKEKKKRKSTRTWLGSNQQPFG